MSISLLGSIGAKLGTDLVGSILEKTLPSAMEFLKSQMKTPSDSFDSIVNSFGNRASRALPAPQFSLELPERLKSLGNGFGRFDLKALSEKLGKLNSIIGFSTRVLDFISRFQAKKLDRQTAGTGPQTGSATTAAPGKTGMNTDASELARSSGYGSSTGSAGSTAGMGPMEMFERMQEAQRAAQMFELAVKIADIQHQAAMSAIRGIRY